MNQILLTKLRKIKYKKFFKLQLIFSILAVVLLLIYLTKDTTENTNMEYLSKTINKNLKVSSMYNVKKQVIEENIYLGRIRIPKIEIEYAVYNQLTEELLKIAPCKFYGVNIGEKGNICIAGHNYNDNRFFGKLDELEIKDEIILIDINSNQYKYIVFDMFESEETDFRCLENSKEYELTLITCNNSNKKRIIVKALLQQ